MDEHNYIYVPHYIMWGTTESPSRAISAALGIIEPRGNIGLPFEAANISPLNKKSSAIS